MISKTELDSFLFEERRVSLILRETTSRITYQNTKDEAQHVDAETRPPDDVEIEKHIGIAKHGNRYINVAHLRDCLVAESMDRRRRPSGAPRKSG